MQKSDKFPAKFSKKGVLKRDDTMLKKTYVIWSFLRQNSKLLKGSILFKKNNKKSFRVPYF